MVAHLQNKPQLKTGKKQIEAGRRFLLLPVLMVFAVGLSACSSSSPFSNSRRFSTPPEQLSPVASSSVQTNSLPPLTSTTNQNGNVLQTPSGTSGTQTGFGFPDDGMESQDPLLAGISNADGSIIAVESTGVPATTQARNLTGGLTTERLLGAWTVISGADQCRVNLTQTQKPGTDRHRASAPNCQMPVLSGIASWKLAGTQVQFFNEGGQIIGTLLQSGNRFIGTLSGGRGISMAG